MNAPTMAEVAVRMIGLNPISDVMVLPSYVIKKPDSESRYMIRATAGEYVPVGVVVRSSLQVAGFHLRSTAIRDGSGRYLDSSSVDIRVVRPWYQAPGAWTSEKNSHQGASVLVPELLVYDWNILRVDNISRKNFLRLGSPGDERYVDVSSARVTREPVMPSVDEYPIHDAISLVPIDLPANYSVEYLLTIKTPENAEPGAYMARVSALSEDSVLIGSLLIEIEILPFKLVESKVEYSIYYRGKLAYGLGTVSSEYKNPQQLRAELTDIKEHGIANPSVYQRLHPKGPHEPRNERESISLLDKYLSIRREVGFLSPDLFFLGRVTDSPSGGVALGKLTSDVHRMGQLAGRLGYEKVYYYGIDEAAESRLLSQKVAWEAVNGAGGRVFAAGGGELVRQMGEVLDMAVLHGPPRRSDLEAARRLSNSLRLYVYGNPQTGPENPVIFRFNYGIGLWRSGYDGAMAYAYQHSMGNIWNDFDHPIYRDHALTYPTATGVIGTIAWEGFREGVTDVRYLQTLEAYVLRCPEVPSAHSAITYLDDLRASAGDSSDPQLIREQVIMLIVALVGECGEDRGVMG